MLSAHLTLHGGDQFSALAIYTLFNSGASFRLSVTHYIHVAVSYIVDIMMDSLNEYDTYVWNSRRLATACTTYRVIENTR